MSNDEKQTSKSPAAADPLAGIPLHREGLRADGTSHNTPPLAERTALVRLLAPQHLHSGHYAAGAEVHTTPAEAARLVRGGAAQLLAKDQKHPALK